MTQREFVKDSSGVTAGLTYKDAGVDIEAKTKAIDRLKLHAQATLGNHAGPIGHFGGTYRMTTAGDQTLVASADGVGTKLRLAFLRGGEAHARVGRDIVNHCANDILALGATPLFFLDYFATGRLDPDVVDAVVGGVATACRESSIALLGGETAEMPDMYADGEYDLAGFIVGSVTDEKIVDGSKIEPGDAVIGLPSYGLQTNGYSLARKIVGLNGNAEHDRELLAQPLPGSTTTIGDALMVGHESFVPVVQPLLAKGLVQGMAHITGGGLTDNLPRTLPDDCIARLDPMQWDVPPIFRWLVEQGNLGVAERYHVFNMGIGFVLVAKPAEAREILALVPQSRRIGQIVERMTSDESAVQGLSC
ncbi:MAG TPA: phosphoribosylformylglycinamidine cyclo-ligase [Thermomicrobiales bacterium]|nr:phosphoribosylformylglycinamidine cyclo-ligase [Thermomicrobiales bacterium]